MDFSDNFITRIFQRTSPIYKFIKGFLTIVKNQRSYFWVREGAYYNSMGFNTRYQADHIVGSTMFLQELLSECLSYLPNKSILHGMVL